MKKSILNFNDEDDIIKRKKIYAALIASAFTVILTVIFFITGCNKEQISPTTSNKNAKSLNTLTSLTGGTVPGKAGVFYTQVNLVADTKDYDPAHVDANLANAWGMAMGEGGFWITSYDKGLALVFNADGQTSREPVDIPFHGMPHGAKPAGIVFNSTPGLIMPETKEITYLLFATEEGTIAAWSSGNSATTVADRSSTGAVYKGIAAASINGPTYIYATNFNSGKIDLFNGAFRYVKSFTDPDMPAGFAPFNIKLMDDKLYVTFARQNPLHDGAAAGDGEGYVCIFNTEGSFLKRFASRGTLNAPWGMARIGTGSNERILIGNYGDGHINIFDMDGNSEGQLMGHDGAIAIQGLRDISFAASAAVTPESAPALEKNVVEGNRLYFTAGPDDGNHGLFGYIEQREVLTPVPVTGTTSTAPVVVNRTK